jgi:hypothetical protein
MSELKDRLQAAQRRIQRILANPLCSELIQKELTIEFYERPDGSIHHQAPEFSPELIDAFILNYRLLVQTKDGISFRQILPSLGECESLGMSHGLLKLQGDFVLCFSLLVDFWVKSMLLAYG